MSDHDKNTKNAAKDAVGSDNLQSLIKSITLTALSERKQKLTKDRYVSYITLQNAHKTQLSRIQSGT